MITDEKQAITKSLALIQVLRWYECFYHIEFKDLHVVLIIDGNFEKVSLSLIRLFLHLILQD